MTAGDEPPSPSVDRIWLLVGAVAVVVLTVALVGVITWVAFDGSDDTEGRLDTESAAEALTAFIGGADFGEEGSARLDACPAGASEEVLGNLAEALGGGALDEIVGGGVITVSAYLVGPPGPDAAALVECLATTDEADGPGELGLIVSPAPLEALDMLRGDSSARDGRGWENLGASRGGQFSGRCGGAADGGDCAVLWHDDSLIAVIGGRGPAFVGYDRERLQATLAAYLPSLVGALAAA